MAIRSYNESYIPYVAENLGVMFEHAIDTGLNPIIFWNTFINSNVAKQIERGNPRYLTCSALDYLDEIYKDRRIKIPYIQHIDKNCFYWAGWILAQFQSYIGYSFYRINRHLPVERVLDLYPTLHEADVTKFFDVAMTYFRRPIEETNLKRIRMARGLSQRQLAMRAEVDLRSIQMYEQRRNNINKAQADTLFRIARVLGCNIEDLLEIY